MPNPQYYLICKKRQEYSLFFQNPPKFLFITQEESLVAINCSKTLKSKRMDARWTRMREMR
jgi:hypothetical protein